MTDEATQNLLNHLRITSDENRTIRTYRRIMRRNRINQSQLEENKEWLEQITKEYEEQKVV